MATLLRFYTFSFVFTLFCLGLGAWYGYATTGSMIGMAQMLWIIFVLSILEISLSFDNAVVNASVLKDMDEVWQRRFLTWGIAFAVFGMRIVFPLAIVAIAADLGPVETVRLSLNDPQRYEELVGAAHVGIAGFGGAFLAMVGLKFFFDGEKDVHWIRAVEERLAKFAALPAAEIGILLLALWGISTLLPDEDALTFLIAGILGLVTFIAVEGINAILEIREQRLHRDVEGGGQLHDRAQRIALHLRETAADEEVLHTGARRQREPAGLRRGDRGGHVHGRAGPDRRSWRRSYLHVCGIARSGLTSRHELRYRLSDRQGLPR